MPLISVITATYNALDGLRRTVESVREQTLDGIEHVIVDGGSTDGTVEYLRSLGDAVRWVSEPDDGIADAMNKGVAMARGEWILVLHADDTFLSPDSAAHAAVELSDHSMISFDVLYDKGSAGAERLYSRNFSWFTQFRMLNHHQGLFCKRDVFDKIGGFDKSYCLAMDYDHLLRAKLNGLKLKAIPKIVTVMPANGVSSRQSWSVRHQIMAEQANIHRKNARGRWDRLAYALFWCGFYPAYFLKWHFFRNKRFY